MSEFDREKYEDMVLGFFDGDTEKADLWWSTPNPNFGGISPNYFIKLKRSNKLAQFIDAQLGEE